MPRSLTVLLIIATSLALWACASNRKTGRGAGQDASTAKPASEVMDDQYEVPPPRRTVPEVMHAKLAHAQAILEGIVLADFTQSESNAMALKRISEGGDWLAQDSAAYFAFSAEFRTVCDDVVNHSRLKNLKAMVADYGRLTNSCVACHEYLRKERQTKDMPGRVSMRGATHIMHDQAEHRLQ